MEHAFSELRSIVGKIKDPIEDTNSQVQYACALVAELAYHHVETYELEVDDVKKRAKLVPCEGFRQIVTGRTTFDVRQFLVRQDFPSFIVVDRAVTAVGTLLDNKLFIGFRGTLPFYSYDWRVNLNARLTPMCDSRFGLPYRGLGHLFGCVHRGFGEEAFRISMKLRGAVNEMQRSRPISHYFFTGHSLGGAVSAISALHLSFHPSTTCVFGSPRYCDLPAFCCWPIEPPVQIKRKGDLVPLTPPRRLGYADILRVFDTSGKEVIEYGQDSLDVRSAAAWTGFAARGFGPHIMERYRRELGATADAALWDCQLTSNKRIKLRDLD